MFFLLLLYLLVKSKVERAGQISLRAGGYFYELYRMFTDMLGSSII